MLVLYNVPSCCPLNPSPFGGSTSVVRDVGHIPNAGNRQPCCLQRTDGGFSASTRSIDKHIDLPQPLVHTPTGCLFCCPLGSECGSFAGAFEPYGARAGRPDHSPLGISNRDQGIVEGRMNISPAPGNDLSFSAPTSWSGHWPPLLLATGAASAASYCPPGTLPGPGVGAGTLSPQRKSTAMP